MINFCVKLCLDMKIYTNFVDRCVRFLPMNHAKNRIINLK